MLSHTSVNGAGASAVEISANSSTVFGGKRNGLVSGHHRGQDEGGGQDAKDQHTGIIRGSPPIMNGLDHFSNGMYAGGCTR
jgi:hypothetical protein